MPEPRTLSRTMPKLRSLAAFTQAKTKEARRRIKGFKAPGNEAEESWWWCEERGRRHGGLISVSIGVEEKFGYRTKRHSEELANVVRYLQGQCRRKLVLATRCLGTCEPVI